MNYSYIVEYTELMYDGENDWIYQFYVKFNADNNIRWFIGQKEHELWRANFYHELRETLRGISKMGEEWDLYRLNTGCYIKFKDPAYATLFKLKFHGV